MPRKILKKYSSKTYWKNRSVLITGVNGFIGSNLIRKLSLLNNVHISNIDKISYSSSKEALKDIKNKKISLSLDAGFSPTQKFSNHYQSGALSFEITSNGKKLISNCGYYNKKNIKLNELSKSTAAHNSLTIDDHSSCKFRKIKNIHCLYALLVFHFQKY